MKKVLMFVAALIVLASCSEENDVVYSVDPALALYVDAFYQDAAAEGINLPKNLVAELKSTQAVTNFYKQHDQNYLQYNSQLITTASDEDKMKNVYHALGGLMLKKNTNVYEQSLAEMKVEIFSK